MGNLLYFSLFYIELRLLVNEDSMESNIVDYDNLSEEIKEKYKIVELGKEEILKKPCKIIEMGEDSSRVKLWVWKNIILKTEMSQMGIKVVMIATKLDTNPDFPPNIFVLPADFEMKQNEGDGDLKEE